MQSLPNAHLAVVDERKITAYLLSDSHPAGRAKAAYFRQFGFRLATWEALRDALLSHARAGLVTSEVETEFGTKYCIEGGLTAPDGRTPNVRSVWFVSTNDDSPRLVTAYPAHGGEE